MLWRCLLGLCSWFQFPVQETEHVPDHLVLVIFQFCQKIVKYCKYKVGIHFLNTWNILYSIFTVLQNSPQAILYYCTHWVLYWYAVLQFSSESRFLTYPHFGKSGWWMLQCTCSNVAVLFAQPPLLLDHGWPHDQPKWLGSHQRLRSLAFLILVLLSYSHSSGSASVSNVGIHCSKTEELTCFPFMLKLWLLIVKLCDGCLPLRWVSVHIWMAVCSVWKQDIFCMKIVPKAENCV